MSARALKVSVEALPTVRRIGPADLDWALRAGWNDFREKRGDLIFVALLYPLIGLLAAVFAMNDAALPLFFPVVAGLSILGPAVASGFYEIARRRAERLDATWRHFFDPLRGAKGTTIVTLTVGLAILFLLWLSAAYAIYAATLGPGYPVGLAPFVHDVITTPQGWTLIVAGNVVGFIFAVVTLVTTLTSFPMAVDRDVAPAIAVETSIRAVQANPLTIASWGLRVALLLLIGCLPAFIGLAVVLPVLGYATWHLYTRLIDRD